MIVSSDVMETGHDCKLGHYICTMGVVWFESFFLFHIQSSQPLERLLRRFWQRALSKLSLYPILTDHSARIILICKRELVRVVAIITAKNKHGRIILYNMCNIDKSGHIVEKKNVTCVKISSIWSNWWYIRVNKEIYFPQKSYVLQLNFLGACIFHLQSDSSTLSLSDI